MIHVEVSRSCSVGLTCEVTEGLHWSMSLFGHDSTVFSCFGLVSGNKQTINISNTTNKWESTADGHKGSAEQHVFRPAGSVC